jgi:hypothetical protein
MPEKIEVFSFEGFQVFLALLNESMQSREGKVKVKYILVHCGNQRSLKTTGG